jgi:hypothetical protein
VDPKSLNPDPHPTFQVNLDPDPIRIQGFDDQKLKEKNAAENILYTSFFDQKLQFTYVQATGDAFSSQKRTSKKLNLLTFFYVCG